MNDQNYEETELIKRVEKAARDGVTQGSRRSGILFYVITIFVMAVIALLVGLYMKRSVEHSWQDFAEELKNQFSFEDSAESHDEVLENDGFLGYTAADFADAILGDTRQLKKLEVYEAEVSDAATLTDTGLANLAIFSRTQVVTYHGTVVYTVDLSKLSKNSISFDETHKTITLYIPHAKEEEINIPGNRMEFGDTERGWLAFGEIKLTAEQLAKVENIAREKMQARLDEDKAEDTADRFAVMSVWEIYQPIVSSVSPEYKLEVAFE